MTLDCKIGRHIPILELNNLSNPIGSGDHVFLNPIQVLKFVQDVLDPLKVGQGVLEESLNCEPNYNDLTRIEKHPYH